MKCILCGSEIPEASRFCNVCGCEQTVDAGVNQNNLVDNTKEASIDSQFEQDTTKRIHMRRRPLLQSDGCTLPEEKTSAQTCLKNRMAIKATVFAVTLILILVSTIVIPIWSRNQILGEAITEMQNGNYYEATKLMERIIKYRQKDILKVSSEHLLYLCEKEDYDHAYSWILNLRMSNAMSEDNIKQLENEVYHSEAEYLLRCGNYYRAYVIFNELGNYHDSALRAKMIYDSHMDVFYQVAVSLYQEGNFANASNWFIKLGDYEDSEEYIRKIEYMESLKGTYEYTTNSHTFDRRYIFNGFSFTRYTRIGSGTYQEDKEAYIIQVLPWNDGYCMYRGNEEHGTAYCADKEYISLFEAHIEDGKVITEEDNGYIKRISPQTKALRNPQIGMTGAELRLSTWGPPDEINKRTYSWGTSEQWVYDGYRYIYLENGLTTSIKE